MSHFAILAHQNSLFVGWGAFERSAEPVPNAFYINNFELSQKKPWLLFENFKAYNLLETSLSEEFLAHLPLPENWIIEDNTRFNNHYAQATQAFESKGLRKILLSICDRGDANANIKTLRRLPPLGTGYFFAWNIEGHETREGAWGLSPELLFDYNFAVKQISTMALAGTFEVNSEARHLPEHEEVTHFFNELALRNHLKLHVQATEKVAYGDLKHLKTEILFTELNSQKTCQNTIDDWIREFHPTPALGVSPRNLENLELLAQLRAELPQFFGAPFGIYQESLCRMIVMIRGVFYQNENLYRPIGVGVTPASNAVTEWQEIELKRSVLEKMWNPLT